MMPNSTGKTVTVIGGGVAGMSAACALAEAGFRVQLVERRGYLGGRASSYLHPGVNEVIDNCQHVLFGCCTNLIGFYRRIGAHDKIHWTSDMTMIEPGGRQSKLGPTPLLPAPLHGLPQLLTSSAFSLEDKLSLARAFRAMLRPVPADSRETLAEWLVRHKQSRGAMERFWRLVIASALNAEIDCIAVPYAAKVIRELFMNSAEAGRMGMSSVPLSELYGGAERFLVERGAGVAYNTNVEALAWDESARQWSATARTGELISDYVVLALPFEAMAKLFCPSCRKRGGSQAAAADRAARTLAHLQRAPVVRREITDLDHAVLLDREIHWLYNKGRLQPWRKVKGSYVELVQSASRTFAALPREQALKQALGELAEFFPL